MSQNIYLCDAYARGINHPARLAAFTESGQSGMDASVLIVVQFFHSPTCLVIIGESLHSEVFKSLTWRGVVMNWKTLLSIGAIFFPGVKYLLLAALFVFSSVGTVAAQQACVPAPSGLVSWWPFDEKKGIVAADIVDGNHGTHVNGPDPVNPAQGKVGWALSFDGLDDFVSVPDSSNLDFGTTTDMTVDLWVKPEVLTALVAIRLIHKVSGGDGLDLSGWANGYGFDLVKGITGYKPRFFTGDGAIASEVLVTGAESIPVGSFSHLAYVIDRDVGIKIYVDGVEVGNFATPTNGKSFTNDKPLQFGRAGNQTPGSHGSDPFQGLIDEVELFNRALSQAEIQGIYDAGKKGKCKKQPQPIGGPDLAIEKTHQPQNFQYDGTGQYRITVTNNGLSSTISKIIVIDTLPAGLGLISSASASWNCTAPFSWSLIPQSVTCMYPGQLNPTASITLYLTVQVAPISKFPGGSDEVKNCASVSITGVTDPTPGDNKVCDDVIIIP